MCCGDGCRHRCGGQRHHAEATGGECTSRPSLSRQNNKSWKKKITPRVATCAGSCCPITDRKDAVLGDKRYHKVYACDEFPFQSTMQGTWVSVERLNSPGAYACSVRPAWYVRNTEDGGQLAAFYGTERILAVDGNRRKTTLDYFYVEAYVPGQNPQH
ncbi:NucA/NucB deoxyribonuclease domain-containing protein [Microbispora sp. CA-135349]|uniref:NucA/NucB deoxyribonuclease domain-containing protein n=1 Tax=Microbispora sp. CA-135349 TaxID=3239953 RepID=UPI003D93B178